MTTLTAPAPAPFARIAPAAATDVIDDVLDAALLERIVAGDESALEQLYTRHIGRVYGLALRIVGSTGLAEDIAAAVFAQLWQEAAHGDAAQRAARSVLAAMLADCRRRALAALAQSGADPAAARAPQVLDLQDLFAACALDGALQETLARMLPEQRAILAMIVFHDLSDADIGKHLDMAASTVALLTEHALQALQGAAPR